MNIEFDDFDYMSLFSVDKKKFERHSWNVKSKWMLNLMIISMIILMMILFSYDFWKRKNIEFNNFDDEIRSFTILEMKEHWIRW